MQHHRIAVIDKHTSRRAILRVENFSFNIPIIELSLISLCSLSHYNLSLTFPIILIFCPWGFLALQLKPFPSFCLQLFASFFMLLSGWQSFPQIRNKYEMRQNCEVWMSGKCGKLKYLVVIPRISCCNLNGGRKLFSEQSCICSCCRLSSISCLFSV